MNKSLLFIASLIVCSTSFGETLEQWTRRFAPIATAKSQKCTPPNSAIATFGSNFLQGRVKDTETRCDFVVSPWYNLETTQMNWAFYEIVVAPTKSEIACTEGVISITYAGPQHVAVTTQTATITESKQDGLVIWNIQHKTTTPVEWESAIYNFKTRYEEVEIHADQKGNIFEVIATQHNLKKTIICEFMIPVS